MRQRNDLLETLLKHWRQQDLLQTLTSLYSIKDPNIFCDALTCTFADPLIAAKPLQAFSLDQADHLMKKCVDILSTDKFKFHL
jgi:hypothetical protein